jgi:hypothetical protein
VFLGTGARNATTDLEKGLQRTSSDLPLTPGAFDFCDLQRNGSAVEFFPAI